MDKNPRAAKASSRPHQDTHAAARAPTLDRAARSTSVVATIVCALLPFAPAFAHADTPMAYTVGFGARNYPVVNLLWALLIVSLLVILIVTGLLVGGLIRRRDVPLSNDPRLVPLERPERGLGWIYIGTAISAAVLVGATIWTCSTLAAVSGPPRDAKVKIHVIGHQWWWEVRYDRSRPASPCGSNSRASTSFTPSGCPSSAANRPDPRPAERHLDRGGSARHLSRPMR